MATQYSDGFSSTDPVTVRNSIQSSIGAIVDQMTLAEESPDWTTLSVSHKTLATGWAAMPSVHAYGVVMSSL